MQSFYEAFSLPLLIAVFLRILKSDNPTFTVCLHASLSLPKRLCHAKCLEVSLAYVLEA